MICFLKSASLPFIMMGLLFAAPIVLAQQPTKINPVSLQIMRGAESAITTLAWSPDGILYSGDWYANIAPWKVGRRTPGRAFKNQVGFVRSLEILNGGKQYLACVNGCVVIGKLPGGSVATEFRKFTSDSPQFNKMAVASSDHKTIAVVTGDYEVKLFDTTKGNETGKLTLPAGAKASAICPTPQGGWLVTAIGVHHFPAGGLTPDFTIGSELGLGHIAVSPDGKRVAAMGVKQFFLGDLTAGASLSLVATSTETSESLAWSPDSKRVAISRDNGLVEFFDPSTGKVVEILTLFKGQASCLAYSPDGRWLAIGSGHYLDMKMKPPRQMTGDNSVRLLPVRHTALRTSL